MTGILSWICLFAAAFFFGIAATIKLITSMSERNSDYAGGDGCFGNFISTIATLIGIYLMYLSITGY